jgi:N-acetylglucosaminyl-diphospho-decaprenol L-rhamnosyltransferase
LRPQEAVMPQKLSLPRSVSPNRTPPAAVAVSVCIANWNCVALLRRCLESLFHHEQGVTFEVVIVDNASSDGAADMVAAEFPQATLIRNVENRGFSVANNQAAEVARGRYFFFLNNDTVVPPNTLGQFCEFAEANPSVGMVGPRLRGTDGANQISYRRRPTLGALLHRISLLRWTGLFRRAYYDYRRDSYEAEGVRRVEVLMGAAVFLHRAVFEDSGRWDERYGFGVEDIDLSMQVGRRRPLVYMGDVEVLHYGRVASRGNVNFVAPNVATGYVRYFRKAGVSPNVLRLYKFLVTLDAPVQCAGKLVQGGIRLLRGQPERAKRSWLAARGLMQFLRTELVRFWVA